MRAANQAVINSLQSKMIPIRASQPRGSGFLADNANVDTPPNDVPNNLLLKYNDITGPEWDVADQTATYQGNGWWEYAVTDGLTTTRSLVQCLGWGVNGDTSSPGCLHLRCSQ